MIKYQFEFLAANDTPLVGCNYQIMWGAKELKSGQADSKGIASFDSELVNNRKIRVRFWAKGQPKDAAFESIDFSWVENIVTQPVKAPVIYEMPLRETENKDGEKAEYRQAYYEVQSGDTWEKIARECETNVSLIKFINELSDDDSVLQKGLILLLPREAKRPSKQREGIKDENTKTVEKANNLMTEAGNTESEKTVLQDITEEISTISKLEKIDLDVGLPNEERKLNKVAEKKIEENKPKTEQQRSAENGKPEMKATSSEKLVCCCNRNINISEFKQVTSNLKALSYLEILNQEFKRFEINTCIEKAYFIAHTLHETAQYTLLEEGGVNEQQEIISYKGYKGRGLMQLTWEDNYRLYGKAALGNEKAFLNQGKYRIAREKEHAVGSGIWFWKYRLLSKYALKNDFIAISAIVNGGFNGFKDRERYYRKAIQAFKVHYCQNIDKTVIATLNNYKVFEKSHVYNHMIGEAFGWGLWHDPQTRQRGTEKNKVLAKAGYQRFLELSSERQYPFGFNNKKREEKKRYGYKGTSAVSFAKKRISEL